MGCRNGVFFPEEENAISDSLSDALLFATMCIIGLPVDVHVKDGSIYSGIFHTACVDDDYGGYAGIYRNAIVLKKARMIKKGNRVANIANGRLIETLIILSEDLVQVVAKGVLLSAEGISGKVGADDVGATAGLVSENVHQEREANGSNSIISSKEKKCINYTRHLDLFGNGFLNESAPDIPLEVENGKSDGSILDKKEEALPVSANGSFPSITVDGHGGEISQGKPSDIEKGPDPQRGQMTTEVKGSRTSFGVCDTISSEDISMETKMEELPNCISSRNSAVVRTEDQSHERHTSEESEETQCSAVLSSSVSAAASESGLSSSSTSTKVVPLKNANHSRTNMESKLNPRAKIFSPSPVHQRSATPPAVPTLASMTYMPDPSPVVPIATAEPEADMTSFVYHSSTPAKFLPHNNLVYGNGCSDLHYAQPIVGHLGSRTQLVRYAGQYNHHQPGAAYVPPNSQNVMAGRLGPFVYLHPVSNDIVTQSTAGFSQVSARPVLAPHPVNLPKHQGNATIQAVQLYATTPLIPNGQQPFAMPGYIPISQPLFPVVGSIPVPGSDGSLSTKFV